MPEDQLDAPRLADSLSDYLYDETTALPNAFDADRAAEQIIVAFQAVAGATFSLYFGSMVDTPCFAVSIYQDPEAKYSKWWNGKSLATFKLKAFIASSKELLQDPRNSVGVWYDAESNRTYLEVTATLPFRDKADYTAAIYRGRYYNQIGIYDLEEKVYFALGGTGELPMSAPPISERLPILERGGEL